MDNIYSKIVQINNCELKRKLIKLRCKTKLKSIVYDPKVTALA